MSSDLLHHPSLPFSHFGLRLPIDPTGQQLLDAYNILYYQAQRAVEQFIATDPTGFTLHSTDEGASPISYNLAMTINGMAILPRRNEGSMLRRSDGTEIGFIALNGTTLGGTLMVKYQEEWDVLRTQPKKLDSILQAIGIPKSQRTQT